MGRRVEGRESAGVWYPRQILQDDGVQEEERNKEGGKGPSEDPELPPANEVVGNLPVAAVAEPSMYDDEESLHTEYRGTTQEDLNLPSVPVGTDPQSSSDDEPDEEIEEAHEDLEYASLQSEADVDREPDRHLLESQEEVEYLPSQ